MFLLDLGNNVTCGGIGIAINETIPNLTSLVITLIKVIIPIILIFFGMLDLGKAVIAQKEDEIKKGQQTFVKRLIAAAIVFLVVAIVQIVIGALAGSDDKATITDCIDCFINNKCDFYSDTPATDSNTDSDGN